MEDNDRMGVMVLVSVFGFLGLVPKADGAASSEVNVEPKVVADVAGLLRSVSSVRHPPPLSTLTRVLLGLLSPTTLGKIDLVASVKL